MKSINESMLRGSRDIKILFVYQELDSWIKKDLVALKERYSVREIHFKKFKDIFRILNGVHRADITFSWFGKLHAFFAVLFSKLLKKKSIVVAGGDDVAYVPEIKYGMFSYWWKKWCPLFVFRFADIVIPVSGYTARESIKNAKADPKKIRIIYHGFDDIKFNKIVEIKKKNLALTVGTVTRETATKKGLKLFVESAKYLSDIKFLLIGSHLDDSVDELKKVAPSNVEIMHEVNQDKLIEFYSKAKVYVQASLHESFGCTLAEAMLCECIPVVTRYGAIPEVAGDIGVYVGELTPQNIAEKIKYALSLPDDYGRKARNLIIEKFPLNERKQQIVELIEKIVN